MSNISEWGELEFVVNELVHFSTLLIQNQNVGQIVMNIL